MMCCLLVHHHLDPVVAAYHRSLGLRALKQALTNWSLSMSVQVQELALCVLLLPVSLLSGSVRPHVVVVAMPMGRWTKGWCVVVDPHKELVDALEIHHVPCEVQRIVHTLETPLVVVATHSLP